MIKCPKFVTSEAKAKSFLRTKGVIDKFLNILNLGEFRKLHTQLRQQAKDKYFSNNPSWNEKLFLEEKDGKKIVPNKVVFKQIDNINNIKYSLFVSEDGDVNVEKTVSALSEKFSIPYKIINDVNERYSGKFEDGRVYINLAYVTAETAWHEFAHPFIEQVRDDNIVLYENLKKEITNTDYGQKVLQEVQKHYPELSLEEQIEEAIVETIARFSTGKIGEKDLQQNDSLFQKILSFVSKIKDLLAKMLNTNNVNIADFDNEFTLKHMAEIMQYSGRVNLKNYKNISKIKNDVETIVQFKNQYTVQDLNGVFHNIGAFMNTGGVSGIKNAIEKIIQVISTGNRLELSAFSGKSRIPFTMGNIQLSFKNEAPVMESYLTDVASDLVKRREQLKRVAFQQFTAREDVSEYSSGINDEVFINATKDNIKEIKIIRDITNEELGKLKELSDLTGAPIIQNGNMLYQPMTYRPYKPESVRYSKFYKGGKSTSSEFFVTPNKEYAKEYGEVSEVDVELGNVLDLTNDYSDATYGSKVISLLESKGVTFTKQEKENIKNNNLSNEPLFSIIGRNPEIKDAIKRSGFNSVKQLETKTTDKFGMWDNSTLNESYFILSNPNNAVTPTTSGPAKYSKFTNESQEKKIAGLTKKITTYLSNFGISVNDYSEIKENLNIDDFGFADVLSKIAHVSDPKQLPTIAGEFIAYMLQHRDVVKNVVTSFANANKELITTRNAIYYVASGLGKSELAKKNPNKFADMDELIANAVMEVYGEEYGTKENSKKIYEDELVQKALKNQIESVMKTKIILSPISPEKLKTIGFYYKKHYVPSEVNIDKILKGISSRTTNPYEVDRDTYKKIYVDPYFESKNVFTVEGYISDEFQDMNDLSQLLEEFLDRKDYTQGDNYSELDKQKYFKLIGELVGRELQKKEGINISKSLFEKIKEIIKRFYKLLTKNEVRGVNVNVGFIADAILENDKDFITASQFKPGAEGKPVSRVSVEKALETDSFGKIIVYTLAEEGFILTGSTALSEQGTILRPDENPLHDIDWVSPFTRADTTQKFFKHYPNAIKVRTIENETYLTDSYLIAPEGHYIANYQEIITSTGKVLIGSYDVMNTDGEVVGTYRLEKNEEGKLKEVEKNVKGKVIDFFIYPDYNVRNKYKPFEYTSDEGANIKLANWRDIFAAKLEWSRLKDVWDYNRFIPFEQQESLSLQIDKLIQKGIVKAKCN